MPKGNYTRNYIAFSGSTIHGYGLTPECAVRSARRKGKAGELRTALAAKALIEEVKLGGKTRFVLASNGRACLSAR